MLSRLVELEPAQADLLNAILAKPVASYTDLASAGVTWPGPHANDVQRIPNYAEADQGDQSEGLDGQLGFTFGGT
ncbi:hypothetical protein MAGR_60460 [Mycolicibacterium agri]|uniref:Uncharacterized protein n=1 Tax=Mycolicibacterium agri TaxID=36811 RepID=A0A7I9WA68_MYCAG|nr:hypothetical protein [Mycolicibacterium agri]GFG54605.1 hypothetical protein MAGR_60460 [Mycolicibacterium agri]